MSLIRSLGSQKAYVRCYRLAYSETVRHFRSTARFTDLNNIRSTVNRHSEPGLEGAKSLLFVERRHLPPDLTLELNGSQAFHRFCKIIGFAAEVHELRIRQGKLPASPADHSSSTTRHCIGFPVTAPVMKVDLTSSLSFHEIELRGFLGELFPSAGRLMVLNINKNDGQPLLSGDMQYIIRKFSATLQRS